MLKNILKKIRHLEFFANNKIDSLFAGNYRSAFRGRGIEFADIRPYDTGDDVRDIDWKTSSKQGEIFVKTYHESRDNTLFFVIDGTASMQFSSVSEMKYERLLETFSLLAFSALKNGDRVGILWYDGVRTKIFPPKKGKKNILKILMFCIEQYTNPSKNFVEKPDIKKVFQTVFSFLKHSSSIFWLTGDVCEFSSAEKKYLKMLRLKHDVIPMVFSDPMEENFSQTGKISLQDAFSGEISSVFVDEAVQKEFSKIRKVKKLTFQKFFQDIKTQTLFIAYSDNIFKTLYLFFQRRQRVM